MQEYFKLIRQALSENRKKGEIYYEAHHIIPKSFKKHSSTVLLTPEEHYRCHKILAEFFKNHSQYGKKMLWAFHRLSYDNKRKLTEEEYGEARKILQKLWTAKRTESHKENIRKTRKGTKTVVHPETKQVKYIPEEELEKWLKGGWQNTNRKKGLTITLSEEGKKKLKQVRKETQTGKTGFYAKAAKGPYTVEFTDGRKFTEGSFPELSKKTNIPFVTLQYRFAQKKGEVLKGWTIY